MSKYNKCPECKYWTRINNIWGYCEHPLALTHKDTYQKKDKFKSGKVWTVHHTNSRSIYQRACKLRFEKEELLC